MAVLVGGRGPNRVAVLVLLGATSAARPAGAGDDHSFLFGDQASMTGGAVVASSRDTASIWYNPAGLGQNRRGRLELSATAFTLRWRKIPDGLVLDLPSRRVERPIESRALYVVPTALCAARELSPGLSVGLGLFATEQDLFDFKQNVSTSDGATDLDLAGALSGTVLRYHAGPSIGWQATPALRLGASLFAVYEKRHEFRKLFADARTPGATYDSTFFQRLVDAHETRVGSELVLGAQLEPGAGWELGVSLRSPRLVFYEHAETDNSTALISSSTTAPPIAVSSVDHQPIGAEGTGFTRPPRFVGGVAKHVGAVELSGEVEVQPQGIGGDAAERTILNLRTGLLWSVADETLLGAGAFTNHNGEGPPVTFPDARVDYYGAALGWKQKNVLRVRSEERSGSLQFSTTVALRYAVGLGQSTRIRFDFRNTPNDGLVGRVADEQVDVVYHELSLYLGTGFEF